MRGWGLGVTVAALSAACSAHTADYFNDLESYSIGQHLSVFSDTPSFSDVGILASGTIVDLAGNKVLLLDEEGSDGRSYVSWFGGFTTFTRPNGHVVEAYALIVNPTFDLILPEGGRYFVQGDSVALGPGTYHEEFRRAYPAGQAVYTRGAGPTYIDNLSFARVAQPIPEPSTWVLAIAGFGLAGATLRHRRLTA